MDIQSKIAARRAELANQADAAARLAQAEAAEKLRRETEERKEALSDLAAELSENGTQVTSNGANLSIAAESPLAPLDAADFRRSALQSLLNKEARQRFSPWENWGMIAPLAAGIALLLAIPVFGLLLIAIGVGLRFHYMEQHRKKLRSEFPELFSNNA
jgi:hypothetical protein